MTADLEQLTIDATLKFPPLGSLSEVNRTKLVAKLARGVQSANRIGGTKGEFCAAAKAQVAVSPWNDNLLNALSDAAFRELTHWLYDRLRDQREAVT
jgi:hypothetical protein